jgi:hypothetical protein
VEAVVATAELIFTCFDEFSSGSVAGDGARLLEDMRVCMYEVLGRHLLES